MAADPPHLPEVLGGAHLEDLHLEELLDRLADLDLVRIGMHAEDELVARLVHQRALLRDDRALHDVHELHAAPPRRRTIPSMASRVTISVGCPSTSYTLSPITGNVFTPGMLRAARATLSSAGSAITMSAPPSTPRPLSHATINFVLGSGSVTASTTISFPSAWRTDTALESAARRADFGRR